MPWNAGQHNRGWSFTLTVQFPPLPSIPPAFRVDPPRRSDFTLSLQGEPVLHNLYLSDTSLVVEMDLFSEITEDRWTCGLTDGPCQTAGIDLLVTDPAHGAVAQFFGVVRNHNEGLAAAAVDYDVHPELASKALAENSKRLLRVLHLKYLLQEALHPI